MSTTIPIIRKIVIPIAGYGTRMFPATKVLPKALFPLIDPEDNLAKPILYMLCDMSLKALFEQEGLTEQERDNELKLIIVIQESQRSFIEHFFFDSELDHVYARDDVMKQQVERIKQIARYIEIVVQREQAGLGHAIMITRDHLKNEKAFMVLLGDHMYISPSRSGSCITQMINAFRKSGGNTSVTGVTTTVESELSVNGILKMDETSLVAEEPTTIFKLKSTQEKPSTQVAEEHDLFLQDKHLTLLGLSKHPSERQCLCYLGIDILTVDIFQHMEQCWADLQEKNKNMEKKEELNLRMHGMKQLIESPDQGMYAIVIDGRRCDTGLPVPYLESMNQVFYNK